MTVPLALDLSLLPCALVGSGRPIRKRLAFLTGERVERLSVFIDDPDPLEELRPGWTLARRLPHDSELDGLRVLFVAGVTRPVAVDLAERARRRRILVNVEDDLPLCDFHVPAVIRRGDLAISISTGGASPTLARRLREHLGRTYPEPWSEHLVRIAELRRKLRAEGATPGEVAAATDALINSEGWLPPA